MIGAIAGDIVGSRFEFHNQKSKLFTLFAPDCRPTDDSFMTLAVGQAVLDAQAGGDLAAAAVMHMQQLGRRFPACGFGAGFFRWLQQPDPQPYNSYGNGAAMRISAVGDLAPSVDTAKAWSYAVTAVSHNHPEGLKGAEAVAVGMVLLRQGVEPDALRTRICRDYGYALDRSLDEIRPAYTFDVSCQGSVPQAFLAFFESCSYEDTLRNAVSIGGDSDTLCAMAGALAACRYGVPDEIAAQALAYLPEDLQQVVRQIDRMHPLADCKQR